MVNWQGEFHNFQFQVRYGIRRFETSENHAYIGMIESRSPVKRVLEYLEEKGESREKLNQVHTPIGQRQVGKSTMLNHLREKERRYVTLDDMNARRLAEQDAGLFFETYGAPLLIDEFQRFVL